MKRFATQDAERSVSAPPSWRKHLAVLPVIYGSLLLTHLSLLRLPYFWDEAGYFIPAARDILLTGDLIPHSTLSNAHPPLLMIWLAAAWKVFTYTPLVTRGAMLLLASVALLGLWRLGCVLVNRKVAAATVACTALYPVFFAQSSLAHLDMLVAALTLWGLAFHVERKHTLAVVALALAPLAKETAIVAPFALFAWELICPLLNKYAGAPYELGMLHDRRRRAFAFLLCCIPLSLWFAYHRHRTGFVLGNPEYLRYNLQATAHPLRIAIAFCMRLWHAFGYLNLFVLTAVAAVSLRMKPISDHGKPRPGLPAQALAVLGVVLFGYLAGLSILGGAVLARYMVPVVPLVILICVATIYRRLPGWQYAIALAVIAFVLGSIFNPPYRFAPEDNLTYADYVSMHQQAAHCLAEHNRGDAVLTAWPASDEIAKPYLGYVQKPMPVLRIENFSAPQVQIAAAASAQYSWAYVFSTKYQPPRFLTKWPLWNRLLERFFDDHSDLPPETIAMLLNGKIVYSQRRRGEWVAVIRIEGAQHAALRILDNRP